MSFILNIFKGSLFGFCFTLLVTPPLDARITPGFGIGLYHLKQDISARLARGRLMEIRHITRLELTNDIKDPDFVLAFSESVLLMQARGSSRFLYDMKRGQVLI